MKTVDLAPEAAEDALVILSRHVGLDAEIGRPILARRQEEGAVTVLAGLTDGELICWWVWPRLARRLRALPGDRAELVDYADGREQCRVIRHERDLGWDERV